MHKTGTLLTMKDIKNRFGCNMCIPTFCLTDSKIVYITPESFPDLPCVTAIRMSCNVPLLFDNFKYMNKYYIDGGFMDNFPIDHLDKVGNKTIGISIDYEYTFDLESESTNVLHYVNYLSYLKVCQTEKEKLNRVSDRVKICVLDTSKVKAFSFKLTNPEKMDLFSDGYLRMTDYVTHNLV
jgi:NTE family protein